ncbi:peroxide stress protein YaaA [Paucibacter sp. APW11]|uniref:UPF0246 protein RQP53_06925 n=1 Tax=Roseateles aquae TaxID=3077235 RepID=A0ABU3P8U7_9BURK|nr:peroxide stress protein YaaA [Paucibacter sp. APW11]MDT8998997.1 peroxide stress protein YaaA [Paucibacter sp. APW11]
MLFLLSPAKSLDYETPVPADVQSLATQPLFVKEAQALIKLLRKQTPRQIAELMDLSDALAALNVGRYQAWEPKFDAETSKPCVLAFNGDVYDGLQARTLKLDDLQWAQQHLAILSGLYGVLRPLDWMRPYRLEMGTGLASSRGKTLYAWWGDQLAEHLNQRAAASQVPVIVNLASQEYFKAARRPCLQPRVIDCQFEDWKNGQYKIISFFAKRARGLMARYCIERRIDTPAGLQGFNLDGYAYQPELSTPDKLLFRRRLA